MLIKSWAAILFITLYSYRSYAEVNSLNKSIVKQNIYLSEKFDSLAIEIDEFFSQRKVVSYKNKSQLKLIGYNEWREGGQVTTSGHINADLRLPNLEKEWMLKFSSFDDQDEFGGLNRNRPGASPGEERYNASLAYIKEFGSLKTTFQPRIELKDPLVSAFYLRFNQDIKLKNSWLARFQLKLFAHSENGSGEAFSVDFKRDITESSSIGFINEQQYLDLQNVFSMAQGPEYAYVFNDRLILSNSLIFLSRNRSAITMGEVPLEVNSVLSRERYHLESYTYYITLGHKWYKNVFHYQITPNLVFRKINNFKGDAGINFRAEVLF